MKVVLNENVREVGKKGDLVEVSRGYARNCLLPQNLARPATEKVLKETEELREKAQKNKEALIGKFDAIEKMLNDSEIVFVEKAGEDGSLYGSVKKTQIAEKIEEVIGEEFYAEFIVGESTLKTVGEHEVSLKFGEQEAQIKVVIKSE